MLNGADPSEGLLKCIWRWALDFAYFREWRIVSNCDLDNGICWAVPRLLTDLTSPECDRMMVSAGLVPGVGVCRTILFT